MGQANSCIPPFRHPFQHGQGDEGHEGSKKSSSGACPKGDEGDEGDEGSEMKATKAMKATRSIWFSMVETLISAMVEAVAGELGEEFSQLSLSTHSGAGGRVVTQALYILSLRCCSWEKKK